MVLSVVRNGAAIFAHKKVIMQFSTYTDRDPQAIAGDFNVTISSGHASARAKKVLHEVGLNEVEERGVSWFAILLRQFKSVFIYLLLAAGLLTFALHEYVDTIFIFLFILINTVLGFRQEFHSERTVALLRGYFSFKSKVLRDGNVITLSSRDIVPGDVVYLEAGDRIPADLRFIDISSAQIDESALTGESAPVQKSTATLSRAVSDVYRATNIGFAGTTLVSGEARGIVIATGKNRVMEGISRDDEHSARGGSFERGLSRFSTRVLYVVLITLAAVFIANYFLKAEFSIYNFAVFAIALTISVVPEALPLVVTFSLSRGAERLVKQKVVVKHLPAVEELGSIEVLASDKTGTLTLNELTVSNVMTHDKHELLLLANLCSSVDAESLESSDNSFDKALFKALASSERTELKQWKRLAEIPFDPLRRRNSVLVEKNKGSSGQSPEVLSEPEDSFIRADKPSGIQPLLTPRLGNGKRRLFPFLSPYVANNDPILLVMGAPETLVPFCGLSGERQHEVNAWVSKESTNGHRVIALGKKKHAGASKYSPQDEETGLEFIGLVSFVDPVKPSTHEAVVHARKLGVKLKIITGDNREVAGAVAHEIGLITEHSAVLTGEEFKVMNDAERLRAVEDFHVFARVAPEEKRLIVETLKKNHEVGFLGEAMNDVQALRAADVSIVVDTASDIARSAADIILLKRDLSVIVNGIREGRQVFTNTVKYLKATLLSNLGNFFAVAVASLITDTLPLLPIQILLLNLLSDFPMMVIATDRVDTAELAQPKQYNTKEITTIALILGAVSTLFDFIFFLLFFHLSPEILRTNWFIGSILTELALIFSIRTRSFFLKGKSPSVSLVFFSVLAGIITLVLPFTSKLGPLLGFETPSLIHLGFILLIVLLYFAVTETMKLVIYKHFEKREYNALSAPKVLGEI